jgi:hypothetical protein
MIKSGIINPTVIAWFVFALTIIGCEKERFDIDNPNVAVFVKQLKNGTYDCYEKGESGENLWLLMPEFTPNHISSLIKFAKDTSHIDDFPINPISSRRPYPEGREYFILGECLLWTVEGIRNSYGYGSLDPFIIDTGLSERERYKGLSSTEILIVWELYNQWWLDYKFNEWQDKNPLEGTSFRWF